MAAASFWLLWQERSIASHHFLKTSDFDPRKTPRSVCFLRGSEKWPVSSNDDEEELHRCYRIYQCLPVFTALSGSIFPTSAQACDVTETNLTVRFSSRCWQVFISAFFFKVDGVHQRSF